MNNVPRVLLLSLGRATQRRAESIAQLRVEGVDFEIVEGVDGKLIPDLPQKHPGKLTNGQVGCYLSHLRACRLIVEYDWPYAVVLEDDFLLLRHGELARVVEGIPEGWDYLMLHQFRFGDGGDLRVVDRGEKFNRLLPCGVCTHGQAISRRFAEHYLANHSLPEIAHDLTLCQVSKDPAFLFLELATPLVGLTWAPSIIHE